MEQTKTSKTLAKIRLVSTITAILLLLAILSMGIYAATNITFSGSADLSFSAKDVSATVTGSSIYTNAKDESKSSTTTFTQLGGNDNDGIITPDWSAGESETITLDLGAVAFENWNDTYAVTFTVKNTFETEDKVHAVFTATLGNNEDAYLVFETPANANVECDIEKDNSQTFTITVKADETKKSEILQKGFTNVQLSVSLVLTKTAA